MDNAGACEMLASCCGSIVREYGDGSALRSRTLALAKLRIIRLRCRVGLLILRLGLLRLLSVIM